MDFVFLVTLSLVPVTTKWIINDIGHSSVLTYGVVYLLAILSEVVTFYPFSDCALWRQEEMGEII